MRNLIGAAGLACTMAMGGTAASAQSVGGQTAYDTAEERVIVSPVFSPGLTFRNASGGEVTFYGQFNPAYQWFDDGGETTSGLVDNGNWNSRLGFTIRQPIDSGTLRFRFETALGLRSSALVSQLEQPDWINWRRTSLRWVEVGWDTAYGSVSLGQGSTASDGTANIDDSFTFHAGAADSSDGFSSFRFRDSTGALTDITIGAVNDTFGGNRRFRLRYDTPSYAGVVFSTSFGREVLNPADKRRFYDVAIRWNGELGDVSVKTAASHGWDHDPDGPNERRVAATASLFHNPTGLNLALGASAFIDGPEQVYIRAGWRTDLFDVGTTSFSVDYFRGRDFVTDGARTENYGLYAVQSFDAVSLDVYAGWRRFSYRDRTPTRYQDATGFLLGARWFF